MGIFNGDRAQHHSTGGSTIIAAGTHLDGRITLKDNLHIDGSVEGEIESEANITIGDEGSLTGNLSAKQVYVSGRFSGKIEAQRVEIVSGGQVEGEIEVNDLVIEPGGKFNGTSTILGSVAEPEPPSSQAKASGKSSGDLAEGPA